MRSSLKIKALSVVLVACTGVVNAQHGKQNHISDTLPTKTLKNVMVDAKLKRSGSAYMADVVGTSVYAGKRTNTVQLQPGAMGLPMNLGRTILAKIPGLTMWEMDGAGTQLNIGSRGTDPHRSIEMNMRQNGYNTNSDMFGYPENHFSVPLQAVEEVQLVRGSSSLQFGPQFGGMMNYKMKSGDSTKPFAIESEQTVGGNNFYNSFNAVGGTKGKFDYYAFYDYRHGDGWRDNANFNYHTWYVHAGYQLSKKIHIAAEFSRMDYVQQIAGGLTDAQFRADARQSVRARNFFQPVINIPAFLFEYNISPTTRLEIKTSGIIGERNSVQYINAPNVKDSINTALGTYNPRQVDRDYYNGLTSEARILHLYHIGKMSSIVSGGVRYFTERTKRKQKGVGSTGSDFNLGLAHAYGIDLRLNSNNYAVFAENILQISPRFSITPGFRYEVIRTDLTGVINNATAGIAYKGKRNFPLFGTGLQYEVSASSQAYGNISQAYRPYLYANVTPADRLDKIDPSLKDSKGYNIDLGYRGHINTVFQFDVNAFYLYYGNKVGLIAQTPAGGGAPYLYTTNIGNSVAKGVEMFAELSLLKLSGQSSRNSEWKIFNSLAYNEAKYTSAALNSGGTLKEIDGNYVENAPVWTERCGMDFRYKGLSTGVQFSSTSKSYNDALNTVSSSNGVTGMIPAYQVWDWNIKWQMSKQYFISAAVNNVADEKYFNRRITFYPGPGILPADGRTFYISLGLKM